MRRLLESVATTGARFGMELHWGKFQLLNIRCNMTVSASNGKPIAAKTSMGYLGTTLSSDGRMDSELSRKIGMAWAEYRKLERLWKHTSLPVARKLQCFQAVVVPGLMYSLSTAWLTASQSRRLNGFQARCLRRILRVSPSFISRVSDKSVLQMTCHTQFTQQLLMQQLLLFGRIARSPDSDMLRDLTFISGTLQPATGKFIRKVGRPRLEWASCVAKVAHTVVGANGNLIAAVQDAAGWRQQVHHYTRSM